MEFQPHSFASFKYIFSYASRHLIADDINTKTRNIIAMIDDIVAISLQS